MRFSLGRYFAGIKKEEAMELQIRKSPGLICEIGKIREIRVMFLASSAAQNGRRQELVGAWRH